MYAQEFYSIVVNGVEKFWRSSRREASRYANRLRATHGRYNVWIRPHYRILSADGSPVNL